MSLDKESISVIIAALNEEENLAATYEKVKQAIRGRFEDYEIIIFNDGSTDNTGKVADEIAYKDSNVKVVHHATPMNLGYVYKSGLKKATKQYVILVTGDNDASSKAFEDTFDLRHKADMVIPYHLNPNIRPLSRRLISKSFVFFMNLLFGLKLKYYNGLVLHRTAVIKSIDINTNSFAYQAEALVKLLKRGHTYAEVGIHLDDRQKGSSKACRPKNILGVLNTVFGLIRSEMF